MMIVPRVRMRWCIYSALRDGLLLDLLGTTAGHISGGEAGDLPMVLLLLQVLLLGVMIVLLNVTINAANRRLLLGVVIVKWLLLLLWRLLTRLLL